MFFLFPAIKGRGGEEQRRSTLCALDQSEEFSWKFRTARKERAFVLSGWGIGRLCRRMTVFYGLCSSGVVYTAVQEHIAVVDNTRLLATFFFMSISTTREGKQSVGLVGSGYRRELKSSFLCYNE